MASFRVSAPFLKLKSTISNKNLLRNCVVSCISTNNFIVTYYAKMAFIFPVEHPSENPLHVFNKHGARNISGMLHLGDDVVALVGEDGVLLIWSAETGHVTDTYKVPGATFTNVSKQSPSMLVVCAHESAVPSSSNNNNAVSSTLNNSNVNRNPPPKQ